MGQDIVTRPRYARVEDDDTSHDFAARKETTGKASPKDVNLPDPEKGKVIGRSIHGTSNHVIRGGDDEDPRWAMMTIENLENGRTKDTATNIAGEIRRRQQAKLKALGDEDEKRVVGKIVSAVKEK